MRKNKVKKILLISLVVLLAIGTLGMSLAFFGKDDFTWVKNKVEDAFVKEEEIVQSTKNIALNSNFAINNTENDYYDETVLTSNIGMVVDNWKYLCTADDTYVRDFIMYQTDEGLYIRNDGTAAFNLIQTIDEGIAKYSNKELTLTFSVDGVVYSKTGVLTEIRGIGVSSNGPVKSNVNIFLSNGQCNLAVSVGAGTNSTVNWVQLEEGNVFSGYIPPVVA